MNIQKFESIIKECKKSGVHTGYSDRIGKLRIIVNEMRTIFHIRKDFEEKVCKHCGTDLTNYDINQLSIVFKEKQESLTIFETYMLWMVFKMKQLPIDYAQYHKCIAGKRFIENIKEVKGGLF